jgi:hypothetical protein
MKVDTQPFPSMNMVEGCDRSARRQLDFAFGINMAGPAPRHYIRKEKADPYDQPQKGEKEYITEEKVRHVRNQRPASAYLLKKYEYQCMRIAAYVINRLPQSKLGFKSPHEMLWKVKPTVSHLKVFGCVCYVFVPDHLRSKFEKKAIRCIFVGYDDARKGWRCCDPTRGIATSQGMWCLMKL